MAPHGVEFLGMAVTRCIPAQGLGLFRERPAEEYGYWVFEAAENS